ncbi:MAG TPA: nuclear transport factor 2 family protein [Rhizobacter sp.]
MQANPQDLIALEQKFWQSLVDEDTDAAISMLDEPALMVSSHGAMQFDHGQYRQMADQGSMVVKSFELSDMNVVFPTDETAVLTYRVKQALAMRGKPELIHQDMADSSVWARKGGQWLCVMHTETPVDPTAH